MIDFDKIIKDAIGNTSTSDYETDSVADVDSVIKADTNKPDTSIMNEAFNEANNGETGYTYNNPDIDKYKEELEDRGLYLFSNNVEELQKRIEDSQSNWEKLFNAGAQTVCSEIVLGTGIAVADLCNFILQKACIVDDNDFDNPVSATLTEWQEKFNNEVVPIYYDKDLHVTNGGLTDFGWWMSNIPSIASSLTLLVPSTAAVKGLTMAGKALKVGSHSKTLINGMLGTKKTLEATGKLNAVQSFANSAKTATVVTSVAEIGTNAMLSRIMENYQEARQTYNDVVDIATDEFVNKMNEAAYQEWCNNHKDFLDKHGIDGSSKLAVAQAIAKDSGDETFKDDMSNVVFDVIELYGLKNVWKGARAIKETGAKVTRENMKAARYFAKNESETAKSLAEEGFGRKLADRVSSNFSKGTLLPIAGQLSEGVEEAVNYISSQEGISYGKTLLGYDRPEEFSTRLSEYMDAPELYDSSFWGFMGGVTFNLAGGQIMRAGYNMTKRYEDKKDNNHKTESDKEADETAKYQTGFEYYDLPETKRRISEIQKRVEDSKKYVRDIKGIDSNEKLSPEEKIEKRTDLTKDYISKATVRAMRHGNLGLFKDMFKSKELKQSMIDEKVINKEEADQYINDVLKTIDETVEKYDTELNKITAASSLINVTLDKEDPRDGLRNIPLEYIHIMAQQNLDLTNDIEKINRHNERLDFDINKEVARINKDREEQGLPILDLEDIEKANRIKNTALIIQDLRNQIKELEEDGSITAKLEADKYRNTITKLIKAHTDPYDIVMIGDVMLRDKNFKNTPESDAFMRQINDNYDSDELRAKDEKLIKSLNLDEGFNIFGRNSKPTAFDEKYINEYNDLVKRYSKTLADYSILGTLLENKAINNAQKSLFADTKISTVADVRRQASLIHNTMNEARVHAINASNKIITEMYLKDPISVKSILDAKLRKIKNTDHHLSKEDEKILEDAIDILNLSQGYNADLYDALIKTFKMLDKIDRYGTTQKNSVSSENQISAAETVESITSSNEEKKQNSEEKKAQIKPTTTSPTIDEIINKKYSYNAEHRTLVEDNKGAIQLIHKTGSAGTFVIANDTNNWDPRLNDVFEGPADKTKEFYLASPAIVELKGDKLFLINKGLLKNTVQTESPSTTPEPSGTTTTQAEDENQANQAGISSTGVLEPNGNQNATQSPTTSSEEGAQIAPIQTEEPIQEPEGLPTSFDDRTNIVLQAGKILVDVADKAVDNKENLEQALLAKKEELIKEYKAQGFAENTIEVALNKIIYTDLIPFYSEDVANKKEFESSIVELQIANYDTQHKIIKDLNETVEKVLNNYKKEKGCITIDGKVFINVHDMLRYINERFNDDTVANYIYDSIRGYLNTKEASAKYVVTDEDINADNFLEQIKKTKQELLEEKIKDTNDIITLADITNIAESGTDLDQVIDNINIGDPVSTEVKNDKLLFKINDTPIGYLAIPKIDSKTGRYRGINKGWVVEIYKDDKGIIQSPLKTYITNLILGTDNSSKTINTLLTKYTFDKLTDADKESLAKQIVQLIDNTSASKLHIADADPTKLIDYLASIYKYFNPNYNEDGIIADEADKMIAKNSIAAWFNKVFKSYDDLTNLSRSNNAKITIDSIADGELLKIYNNNEIPRDKHDTLALPSEVLVNKEATIGVSVNAGQFVTKNGIIPISKYSSLGSISLIFPNRNGIPQLAFVSPRKLRDARPNSLMTKINNVITRELYTAVTNGNYNAIKEVLHKYFSNDSDTATLFQGTAYKETYNEKSQGYCITFGIKDGTFITFYEKDIKGNPANQVRISVNGSTRSYFYRTSDCNQQLANALSKIFDNITYGVSAKLINLDGNKRQVLNNGCIDTSNGKFKVTFGTGDYAFTEEYDSYNDFLLTNDLVRVNLKKNENGTSNYDKRSANPNAKSKINVKIEIASSTPVEESKKAEPKAPKVVKHKSLNDAIDNAIVNPKADMSTTLAKLCLTPAKVKTLQNNNLLPSGVEYESDLNKEVTDPNTNKVTLQGPNARYYPKSGKLVVGDKFRALFKSGDAGRSRGIRILIHEQLHALFRVKENEEYKNRAKDVFEEYKEWVAANTTETDKKRIYTFENYKLSTGEEVDYDHKLEEFLIEALTNAELRQYLNEIEAKSIDRTNRKESLLSKLMDIIAKVFGWNKNYLKTKDGSLLDKLNNDLKDIEDFSASSIAEKPKRKSRKKDKTEEALELDFTSKANDIQQTETTVSQTNNSTATSEISNIQNEPTNEHDEQAIQLDLFSAFNDGFNTDDSNAEKSSSSENIDEDVNLDNITLSDATFQTLTEVKTNIGEDSNHNTNEDIDVFYDSNIDEDLNRGDVENIVNDRKQYYQQIMKTTTDIDEYFDAQEKLESINRLEIEQAYRDFVEHNYLSDKDKIRIYNYINNVLLNTPKTISSKRKDINRLSDEYVRGEEGYINEIVDVIRKIFGYDAINEDDFLSTENIENIVKDPNNIRPFVKKAINEFTNRIQTLDSNIKEAYDSKTKLNYKNAVYSRYLKTPDVLSEEDKSYVQNKIDAIKKDPSRKFKSDKQIAGYLLQNVKQEYNRIDNKIKGLYSKRNALNTRRQAFTLTENIEDLIVGKIRKELERYYNYFNKNEELTKLRIERANLKPIFDILTNDIVKQDYTNVAFPDGIGTYKFEDVINNLKVAHPEDSDILDLIANSRLFKENATIEYIDSEYVEDLNGIRKIKGVYSIKTGNITITKNSDYYTILHELVHAATTAAIKDNKNIAKEIKDIMDYVNSYLKERQLHVRSSIFNFSQVYAFTNEYEFIAEAISNPTFQDLLKEIPTKEFTEYSGSSVFVKLLKTIFDSLRKLLHINKEENIYDTTFNKFVDIASIQGNESVNIEESIKAAIKRNDNIEDNYLIDDSYSEEMQSIKDKAITDGTFMKAPNGKPTNLTERQWLQVRTKAFKAWFGDWMNDQENSSKVVDDNGEPLVVYHGTQTKFTEFSKKKRGSYTGAPSAKLAFFAASNKDNSEVYSKVEDIMTATDRLEKAREFDRNLTLADIGAENDISELDITPEKYYYNDIVSIEASYYSLANNYANYLNNKGESKNHKETLTINIKEEWVTDKDLNDYKNDGFIITSEQQEAYERGEDIEIVKHVVERFNAYDVFSRFEENNDFTKAHKEDINRYFNAITEAHKKYEQKLKEFTESKEENNPYILSLFLNIKTPKINDDKNKEYRHIRYSKIISDALQEGKDGGIIKNTKDPLDTDVYYFFEENQVKSATDNVGEFSHDSNNIYESAIDETSSDNVTIVAPEIDKFIARLDPKIAVEFRRRIESDELKTYCR